MSIEHMVRMFAGALILASLALGWWISPYFFLVTAFVGFNLFQSSITKWCLAEKILKKLGLGK